jgi:hypothetical protein
MLRHPVVERRRVVLHRRLCGHDNDFAIAIYLDPSHPHASSFRGAESPRHVLLSEYRGCSSHGQDFLLMVGQ